MQLAFHKPNSKNSGFLFGFKISENKEFFIEAIKQFSWNDETKNGSFKENAKSQDPSKKLSVKLTMFEAGEILNVINSSGAYSTVHVSNKGKTIIACSTKLEEKTVGQNTFKLKRLSFSISKDENKYFMLLAPGELECLRVFLVEFIKISLAK
jgi:hypothetical protein